MNPKPPKASSAKPPRRRDIRKGQLTIRLDHKLRKRTTELAALLPVVTSPNELIVAAMESLVEQVDDPAAPNRLAITLRAMTQAQRNGR